MSTQHCAPEAGVTCLWHSQLQTTNTPLLAPHPGLLLLLLGQRRSLGRLPVLLLQLISSCLGPEEGRMQGELMRMTSYL